MGGRVHVFWQLAPACTPHNQATIIAIYGLALACDRMASPGLLSPVHPISLQVDCLVGVVFQHLGARMAVEVLFSYCFSIFLKI